MSSTLGLNRVNKVSIVTIKTILHLKANIRNNC